MTSFLKQTTEKESVNIHYDYIFKHAERKGMFPNSYSNENSQYNCIVRIFFLRTEYCENKEEDVLSSVVTQQLSSWVLNMHLEFLKVI